jgi:hypothetical protein
MWGLLISLILEQAVGDDVNMVWIQQTLFFLLNTEE